MKKKTTRVNRWFSQIIAAIGSSVQAAGSTGIQTVSNKRKAIVTGFDGKYKRKTRHPRRVFQEMIGEDLRYRLQTKVKRGKNMKVETRKPQGGKRVALMIPSNIILSQNARSVNSVSDDFGGGDSGAFS